jgi:hypothetical protein
LDEGIKGLMPYSRLRGNDKEQHGITRKKWNDKENDKEEGNDKR